MKEQNKRNQELFQDLFFPGAEILYPLLSIVCLFFFFFFFGTGKEYTILHDQAPGWLNWHIFAILGFIFCSLWGIIRKWWGYRFLATGTMILFFSFFTLEECLYHLPKDRYIILMIVLVCSFACGTKLKDNTLKGRIIWMLPVLVFILYYIFGSIRITLVSCLISLICLAILETNGRENAPKVSVPIGIMLFYILTTMTYFPYNPFLSNNIKSVSISYQPRITGYQPRITGLVVEKDNKFIIVNGTSLTGKSPINAKFDCYEEISPYQTVFVGFNTSEYKKYENTILSNKDLKSILFPIVNEDSCVYFSPEISIYKQLNSIKLSTNEKSRLTALIFQDFIDLYETKDTVYIDKLKEHQSSLQEYIEKATTDSLAFNKNHMSNERILKEFSTNLSVGMLNALCSDLVLNKDINSAINIFSYQFFLTFYNTEIYRRVNTNINININKNFNKSFHSDSFHVTDKELKREDTFEPWVKVASLAISLAELYLSDIQSEYQNQAITELREMYNIALGSAKGNFDKENTIVLKNKLQHIEHILSNYQKASTIKRYATLTQKFLYLCVSRNYMPDYNSFFLNRFNEITPMVPMNPESIIAYESMAELYSNRFKQDIEGIEELRKTIDILEGQYDELINLQDSIDMQLQKYGLDPSISNALREFLYANAIKKLGTRKEP